VARASAWPNNTFGTSSSTIGVKRPGYPSLRASDVHRSSICFLEGGLDWSPTARVHSYFFISSMLSQTRAWGAFDCGRRARPFGGRALREQRKLLTPLHPTFRGRALHEHRSPSSSIPFSAPNIC